VFKRGFGEAPEKVGGKGQLKKRNRNPVKIILGKTARHEKGTKIEERTD